MFLVRHHPTSYSILRLNKNFSGKLCPFPLIAVVRDAQAVRYNYKPESDFSFILCDIPIMVLEVYSDKHAEKHYESDRPRLLIQAACLVRLWNHLLGDRVIVIMAVYVDKDFNASCYFLFQGNGLNPARVCRSFIEPALYSHPSAG